MPLGCCLLLSPVSCLPPGAHRIASDNKVPLTDPQYVVMLSGGLTSKELEWKSVALRRQAWFLPHKVWFCVSAFGKGQHMKGFGN